MITNKILLVGLLVLIVVISIYMGRKRGTNEGFYAYYKDTQKIGEGAKGETDDGNQPRSSWRLNDFNYQTCYSDDKVPGNQVARTGTYFCDHQGRGENTPLVGLYPIDFTNYNVAYQKIAKGTRLSGTFMVNGSSYNFDEYGRPTSEHMTLKKSKEVCDALGTKCVGFLFQYPGKTDNYVGRQTYFFSKFDDGLEDPNTYDITMLGPQQRQANQYYLTSWYQFDTYRKLDPYYKEVPMREIKVSGQDYEKRTCSVEQNPNYDLDSMRGTLEDCQAHCATMDNCTGFNRDANTKDTDVANCQFKRVSFDQKIPICPQNYTQRGEECVAGWDSSCDQNCAQNNCTSAGGQWIPKDYSQNPYTCKMPANTQQAVCANAPNRKGLVSYVRKEGANAVQLAQLMCPGGYDNAIKTNFYLVKGNLYVAGKTTLVAPPVADLQQWNVDEQWYSLGAGSNQIAEQVRDFIYNTLNSQPLGAKLCANFNSAPTGDSNGMILVADKQTNNQYSAKLFRKNGAFNFGSFTFSK